MMRARAIENGVFVFCVNRTGVERGNKFFGDSEAVDNRGNVLYKAGKNEVIKTITIDPENTKNKKWNEYNDLFLDRRPELY
jgi:N-carbamoylputrescine amidase